MLTYRVPMVPGPTSVLPEVLAAYRTNYASSDLEEGPDRVIERHRRVADLCRRGVQEMGLRLYPREEAFNSPTVTAVRVPSSLDWAELDRRLRQRGVGVGGNYGILAGKLFRLGHMGIQADETLVHRTLEALRESLALS